MSETVTTPPPAGDLETRGIQPNALRRGLRPVDWYTVVYLAATLPLILFYPDRVPQAVPLAAAHLAGIVLLVGLRNSSFQHTRLGSVLLAFYPLPLFGLFYSEVGVLCRVLHPDLFFDPVVQGWEETLFGGQPSRDLYRALDSRLVGEYLHLGYISYYLMTPLLAFTLWFRRSRREFEHAIATVAFVFYLCFAVFILFPVAGPYHMFDRLDPQLLGFNLPEATRWILDRGSSIGAAFPSSHVAVAVVIWIMALRYHAPLGILLALLVPALAVGAVYGGYHYAVDITAGAVLGVFVGFSGHELTLSLDKHPES